METFLIKVHKGIVTNSKRDTRRVGYWIPVTSLPRRITERFGADRDNARSTLAFDLHQRDWRDMKNAVVEGTSYCNVTVVTMEDGRPSLALLDF